MKMFAMLAFMITLFSIYQTPRDTTEQSKAAVNIINFLLYRECVRDYVFNNKSVAGSISDVNLNLPYGLKNDRWQARVENNILYVFGEASQEEINAAKERSKYSHSIGQKKNGLFYPKYTNPATVLPSFIKENSLVSIIEVVQ